MTALFVPGSSFEIDGTNSPTTFADTSPVLTPGTSTVGSDVLNLTIAIVDDGPTDQWLVFTYSTVSGGPLSPNTMDDWALAQVNLDAAVDVYFLAVYIEWMVGGVVQVPTGPIPTLGFTVMANPVPGYSGTGLGATGSVPYSSGPLPSLGVEIVPYGDINDAGIDPTTVNGYLQAYKFAPQSTPVAPGVPIPACGGIHTTTSFTAEWTPQGAAATSYTLEYRQVGTMPFTTITGITETSYLITGLMPGTTYEFAVEAVNDAGNSGFSSLYDCSTDPLPEVFSGGGRVLCGWRGLSGINWHGMALVGDKFSNVVGLSDFNTFQEYGNVMEWLITSPPVHKDRKRIFVPRFEIEVEAGLGLPNAPASPPIMTLEVSKDGGLTYQALIRARSMGAVGEYLTRIRWLRLGHARQWVFRLGTSDSARPALIGCYIDDIPGLG